MVLLVFLICHCSDTIRSFSAHTIILVKFHYEFLCCLQIYVWHTVESAWFLLKFYLIWINPVLVQDDSNYAAGSQKNVTGEVIRWNNVSGPERIDAKRYIELLEAEIEELNRQVGRKSASGQNELLEYLKTLEPQNLMVRKPSFISLFATCFCWACGLLISLLVTSGIRVCWAYNVI